MTSLRRFSYRSPLEADNEMLANAFGEIQAIPNRKLSEVFGSSAAGRRQGNVSAHRSSMTVTMKERAMLLNELGLNSVTYSPRKSPRKAVPSNQSSSILTDAAISASNSTNIIPNVSTHSNELSITPAMTPRQDSADSIPTSSTNWNSNPGHTFKSIKLSHPDEIEAWFHSHPSRRTSRQLATIWESDEDAKSGERSPDRPGSQRRVVGV